MKTLQTIAIVAALLLPLSAHAVEVGIQAGGGSLIIPSRGFDPFSLNDVLGVGSLSVGVRPIPRGPLHGLGLEIGYLGGSAQDRTWGTFETSLTLNMLSFGASYRYDRPDWFVPYARLLGSVAWGEVDVKGGSSGELSDSAAAYGGTVTVGFELVTPRAWLRPDDDAEGGWWRPRSLGVYLEAGYGLFGNLTFSRAGTPAIPADDERKPEFAVTGPSLGALDLSGPTIRAGFVANF